jgi:hypothetical protein
LGLHVDALGHLQVGIDRDRQRDECHDEGQYRCAWSVLADSVGASATPSS